MNYGDTTPVTGGLMGSNTNKSGEDAQPRSWKPAIVGAAMICLALVVYYFGMTRAMELNARHIYFGFSKTGDLLTFLGTVLIAWNVYANKFSKRMKFGAPIPITGNLRGSDANESVEDLQPQRWKSAKRGAVLICLAFGVYILGMILATELHAKYLYYSFSKTGDLLMLWGSVLIAWNAYLNYFGKRSN
jgi:hypothetical protein